MPAGNLSGVKMTAVRSWFIALSVAVVGMGPIAAGAPPQRQGAGAALPGGAVTPAEIQRMFDAYALLQAQEQLKIADDQFAQFLTRFKALQDARRKALQQRLRIVQELRRILNGGQPDEAQIRERLKMLEDLESRSAGEIRKASEAIDQMLDVRQQAKFRVFEDLMEQRKLELVTRARLANRLKQQPQP